MSDLTSDADASDVRTVNAVTASAATQPSSLRNRPVAISEVIDRYHILELLGEGGMGTVYKAEQRSPIRRIVAIKVIKLGLDTKQVIARFDSERQALARMNHQNVAKVLDAGTTESGRPYFVMEYVPGKPITEFADGEMLSIRQRLELFCQACDGIAHAHFKAIIHRDIKSSNLLAYLENGKQTVKVIDFGIAKAMSGDRLSELTFNTMNSDVVGTLAYMSPEQAESSPDIDTRADVYSLGVVLYELLVGATPFDRQILARAARDEMRRVIREVEPPRPSTHFIELGETATKIAASRQLKVESLAGELRRELEWIPLKAMRKDRSRRYDGAGQLAEDVQRYLSGQTLHAAPESKRYRLQKFVRRHAVAVSAATAVLLAVTLGIAATLIEVSRAVRAEKLAEARAAQAEAATKRAMASELDSRLLLLVIDPFNNDDAWGRKKESLRALLRERENTGAEPTVELAMGWATLGWSPDGNEVDPEASEHALKLLDQLRLAHGDDVAALRGNRIGNFGVSALSLSSSIRQRLIKHYESIGKTSAAAELQRREEQDTQAPQFRDVLETRRALGEATANMIRGIAEGFGKSRTADASNAPPAAPSTDPSH